MKASKDFLKDKIALSPTTTDVEKMLSVENTLAKRRLEERFLSEGCRLPC
jgi:hypothetical protein